MPSFVEVNPVISVFGLVPLELIVAADQKNASKRRWSCRRRI